MRLTNRMRPGNFEIETDLLDQYFKDYEIKIFRECGLFWSMCDLQERYGWTVTNEDRQKDTLRIDADCVVSLYVTCLRYPKPPIIHVLATVDHKGKLYSVPVRI